MHEADCGALDYFSLASDGMRGFQVRLLPLAVDTCTIPKLTYNIWFDMAFHNFYLTTCANKNMYDSHYP